MRIDALGVHAPYDRLQAVSVREHCVEDAAPQLVRDVGGQTRRLAAGPPGSAGSAGSAGSTGSAAGDVPKHLIEELRGIALGRQKVVGATMREVIAHRAHVLPPALERQ